MQSCFLSAEFPDWSEIGSGGKWWAGRKFDCTANFSLLIYQVLLYQRTFGWKKKETELDKKRL